MSAMRTGSEREMLVQEVMTPDPVTVRLGTSVKDALALMARHSVTLLPVVTGSGRVRGVVSEADLIRERVSPDQRLHEIPLEPSTLSPAHVIDEVMTPHVVSVEPDTDLSVAVELMTSTSVKSLPVLDERGDILGIVSRSDVVRLLARADSTLEREVDSVLTSLGHADWLVDVHDGVAEVSGPAGSSERSLARLAARAVPGVIEVRVD
jgi:CBS-domain-containing membrane protein